MRDSPIDTQPETTDDPCVILKELKAQRRNIILGKGVQMIEYRSRYDVARSMEHFKPDLNRLDQEIRTYESLCAAQECRPDPYRLIRAG